jgi:hypothetical protein
VEPVEQVAFVPEDVSCVLYWRKNVRDQADKVRVAAMNALSLVEPFKNTMAAVDWIKANGNTKYIYEIRKHENNATLQRWGHHGRNALANGWHRVWYKQNPNRRYKSDRHPSMRIF